MFKIADLVMILVDAPMGSNFRHGDVATVVETKLQDQRVIDVLDRQAMRWTVGTEHVQLYCTVPNKLEGSTPQGSKLDTGKTPFELLSPVALLGTAEVLKFGANKYAAHNWRKGISWSRLIGACGRHLLAFMLGEDIDPESKLPHIDHLACEVMFLQEFYRQRRDLDDRFKSESVSKTNKEQ